MPGRQGSTTAGRPRRPSSETSSKAFTRKWPMLEPRDRRLLLESLRPPTGYTLDHALGTTFSLDLLALLRAPLAFPLCDGDAALTAADGEGRPADPLALLLALRRQAGRISLFC